MLEQSLQKNGTIVTRTDQYFYCHQSPINFVVEHSKYFSEGYTLDTSLEAMRFFRPLLRH